MAAVFKKAAPIFFAAFLASGFVVFGLWYGGVVRFGREGRVSQPQTIQSAAVNEAAIQQSPVALDPNVYRAPAAPYPVGLNLIFFGDNYLSWQDFERDQAVVKNALQFAEPWKSYSRYNFYEIFPKELDSCFVKTQDERKPALRCNAEIVNRYLGNLRINGHFKLVVLSRRSFQSWANVVRLADSGIFFSTPSSPQNPADETTVGWLFLHLLGHAFGLKDEEPYVIAKADSSPHQPDGPNCAPDKKTAKLWWGDLAGTDKSVGYFTGCAASKRYIKPTEGSLMNLGDLAKFQPDYGPVSERYLQKILAYCFSERAVSVSDDPDFFAQYPDFQECAR